MFVVECWVVGLWRGWFVLVVGVAVVAVVVVVGGGIDGVRGRLRVVVVLVCLYVGPGCL